MLDDIDIQGAFIRTLLTGVREDVFVDTFDLKARLEVYRRNFMQGYCNALKKTYAMTAVYLGDEEFTSAAVRYVCAYRPLAGELFATYGQNFCETLEDPNAKELARFEWVLQLVVMAEEDVSAIDSLGEVSHAWQLRSDVRLFKSPYRIGEGYVTLRALGAADKIVKEDSSYIIYSHKGVPVVVPLSDNESAFLELLQVPQTFEELFDKLTFSKEILVNIISRFSNQMFLKKVCL